jgi:hypothetical protein
MASPLLSGLMGALRALARDNTLLTDRRSLAAEQAIKGYLATGQATRKQMLDELAHEVADETGEFWDTVREIITQLRQTG